MGAGGLRFYAGAPLIASSGARLGSLCVTDVAPRSLTRDQGRLLANFAEVAVRALERDYYDRYALPAAVAPCGGARRSAPASSRLLRSVDTVRRAAAIVDASPDGGWPILCANTRWAFLSAHPAAAVIGASFFALYAPLHGDEASVRADLAASLAAGAGTDFVVDVTPRGGGGGAGSAGARAGAARRNGASSAVAPTTPTLRVVLRPCVAPSLDDDAPAVVVPAGAAAADDDRAPSSLLPYFFAFLAPITTDAASSITPSVAAASSVTASVLTSSHVASHAATDAGTARAESWDAASSLPPPVGTVAATRGCACVIC